MQTYNLGEGTNPSVTWYRDAFIAIWQDWSELHRATVGSGGIASTVGLGGAQAAYPKIHASGDFLFTGWRDGASPFHGHVETVGASVIDDLGPIHGASPLVFGGDDVAYQTGGSTQNYPILLRGLLSDRTEAAGHGKGVGLSRIVDRVVRTWDDERGVVPGLSDPSWAGELVVGATDRDGQPCAVVQHPDGRELELWKGQDSQNPMMAHSDVDGTYCVVAWSAKGQGVRAMIFALADLHPPVEPPEPPTPEPVAKPKVTIASYEPRTGEVPLSVTAVAEVHVTSGPVTTFTWQSRPLGGGVWHEVTNPASDLDHTFTFDTAGTHEIGLRAAGPGGFDQTGTVRTVEALEPEPPVPPEPEPEPEPPVLAEGESVSLKCWDQTHYWCAEEGGGVEGDGCGRATASRTAVGGWESFKTATAPDGRIGFQAIDSGSWLCAEDTGGLWFNRQREAGYVPGAWEAFALEAGLDGGTSIRTDHGTYVQAVGGGGSDLIHAARVVSHSEAAETFFPSRPLIPAAAMAASRIQGQLRFDGKCLCDDTGPVLPVFAHLGDGFAQWIRDRAYVETLLKDIAKAGYHGVRFWTALGGDYWAGLELGPCHQPDYYTLLEQWLRLLQSLGLVCHMSQGGTYPEEIGDDADAFARRCGEVVNAVGSSVVAVWEGANESRDTTPGWDSDRLMQFVSAFKHVCPQVLCMGSAYTGHEDAEITNDYNRGPCDVATYHAMRLDNLASTMQHAFSFAYIGTEYPDKAPVAVVLWIIWNGEGNGPGDLVSATAGQEWMTDETMAAWCGIALMCRQPFNYFCGAGVKCKSEPMQNLPGFWSCPTMANVLPKDVMGWTIFHGGDTWKDIRIFACRSDDARCAQAISPDGTRFCAWHYDGEIEQVRGTVEQTLPYGPATLYMGRV